MERKIDANAATEERFKGMPEIGIISLETAPTVVELGFPDLSKLVFDRLWFGPKNLPSEVEENLRTALKKVSEDPRTQPGSADFPVSLKANIIG